MRVSHAQIYDRAISDTNRTLSELLRLEEQNASQKKVNRPSDDPSAISRILISRSQVREFEAYQENLDTATGWLSTMDSALQQASTILTSIEELAEQAATGTLSASQRDIIAEEARQYFEQLVNLANTEFAGDSIFGGHHIKDSAYSLSVGATALSNSGLSNAILSASGQADATYLVEFSEDAVIGSNASVAYRYSLDGGENWLTGSLDPGETVLEIAGVTVELAPGTAVRGKTDDESGSMFMIRPAAVYEGDDEDGADVRIAGDPEVTATADGQFGEQVVVRIDEDGQIGSGVSYSYSLDGGLTWSEGHTATDGRFPVPGGVLELASNGTGFGSGSVSVGDQFTIAPREAEITIPISSSGEVTVNYPGCEVFGGVYANGETADPNLLEIVGDFIGYLETNDMDGIGRSIEALNDAHEHLSTIEGEVGGRMNRVIVTQSSNDATEEAMDTYLSDAEDADVTELLVEITKAEYTYESVLRTSTTIMSLSLMDYM